jgi:hypothetical protein
MSISITKVKDRLYTVRYLPRHSEPWSTPEPMPRHQIIEELLRRGAHQQDIGDAFYEADPNWLKHK